MAQAVFAWIIYIFSSAVYLVEKLIEPRPLLHAQTNCKLQYVEYMYDSCHRCCCWINWSYPNRPAMRSVYWLCSTTMSNAIDLLIVFYHNEQSHWSIDCVLSQWAMQSVYWLCSTTMSNAIGLLISCSLCSAAIRQSGGEIEISLEISESVLLNCWHHFSWIESGQARLTRSLKVFIV